MVHHTKVPWQVGTKMWGHDRHRENERPKTNTHRELGGWDLLKSV